MKIVYRDTYCTAEELEIREVEIPVPGENQILVKVKASTVNRTDEGVLLGSHLFSGFLRVFPSPNTMQPEQILVEKL